MTFKTYNPKQNLLLPQNFEDFLGESHEAIVLHELIEELDTSILETSYGNSQGGSSAYHPVMLLKILLYSYMNGIFSSRKIEKRLTQDLAFMFLAGSNKPNFRTLLRFRKDKGEFLEDIFIQVTKKAYDLGFIKFGTCSLDGTKIYANASKSKNYTQKNLKEKIKSYIDQADSIDQIENEMYGDNVDDIDPDLKTKEGRKRKKKELEEKQKKAKNKLQQITKLKPPKETTKMNTTDPDSKFMMMKKKDFSNGYNIQVISENRFILNSSIFNVSADQSTLIKTVKKLKHDHKYPNKLLADKGYSSEDNYEFCEKNNIDAYIPVHNEKVDLLKYEYDKKNNIYTDQAGRKFFFKQYMNRRIGVVKRGRPKKSESKKLKKKLYKTMIYEHVDPKTKKKSYLSVSHNWLKFIKKQKDKLSSVLGKQIYKQRMHDVEGVFANIKKNLNFTQFNLRGFIGVNIEWTLISLANNIKKII